MLTLREMNLFTASARAIELAGLIPQQRPRGSAGTRLREDSPTARDAGANEPQDVTSGAVGANSNRKAGRPSDPTKAKVVRFVRELRKKKTLWKNIPDAVFQKFKLRYTSETLRGYLKSG
jgi:hypothetical protein